MCISYALVTFGLFICNDDTTPVGLFICYVDTTPIGLLICYDDTTPVGLFICMASARPFCTLGEITHLVPPYHRNMTHKKFFSNFSTGYFFQQKTPLFPWMTSSLIWFATLFGQFRWISHLSLLIFDKFCTPLLLFLHPPWPCALGGRLVCLMVAPALFICYDDTTPVYTIQSQIQVS